MTRPSLSFMSRFYRRACLAGKALVVGKRLTYAELTGKTGQQEEDLRPEEIF